MGSSNIGHTIDFFSSIYFAGSIVTISRGTPASQIRSFRGITHPDTTKDSQSLQNALFLPPRHYSEKSVSVYLRIVEKKGSESHSHESHFSASLHTAKIFALVCSCNADCYEWLLLTCSQVSRSPRSLFSLFSQSLEVSWLHIAIGVFW